MSSPAAAAGASVGGGMERELVTAMKGVGQAIKLDTSGKSRVSKSSDWLAWQCLVCHPVNKLINTYLIPYTMYGLPMSRAGA